jgi:hypothetical protein
MASEAVALAAVAASRDRWSDLMRDAVRGSEDVGVAIVHPAQRGRQPDPEAALQRGLALLAAMSAAHQPLTRGVFRMFVATMTEVGGASAGLATLTALESALGKVGLSPWHSTVFDGVIAALAREHRLPEAVQLRTRAAAAGAALTVQSFAPVVLAHAQAGDVDAALAELDALHGARLVASRSLLCALAAAVPARAAALVRLGRAQGVLPPPAPHRWLEVPLFGLRAALARVVLAEALDAARAAAGMAVAYFIGYPAFTHSRRVQMARSRRWLGFA